MTKVEILGPGCAKCQKTGEIIEKQIKESGIEAEIKHVTDLDDIAKRGVMMTPAVVVDGEVKVQGKVPKTKEIKSWFE